MHYYKVKVALLRMVRCSDVQSTWNLIQQYED
jgi:hypothetical protein